MASPGGGTGMLEVGSELGTVCKGLGALQVSQNGSLHKLETHSGL